VCLKWKSRFLAIKEALSSNPSTAKKKKRKQFNVDVESGKLVLKKSKGTLGLVAHACNPSYLGG
jgi:hypothetical protein